MQRAQYLGPPLSANTAGVRRDAPVGLSDPNTFARVLADRRGVAQPPLDPSLIDALLAQFDQLCKEEQRRPGTFAEYWEREASLVWV